MGSQLPPKGHSPSQSFGHCLLWPNSWMDHDATKRPCVRWDQSPPPKKGAASPPFSAHVYCGEMAGWIRMPLGKEVGLGPGDVVLVGEPAPLGKGHSRPHISTHFALARSPISAAAEHLYRRLLSNTIRIIAVTTRAQQ